MARRITLDTNVCTFIGDPVGHGDRAAPGTAEALQRAIKSGKVRAFVSEASAFVECLGAGLVVHDRFVDLDRLVDGDLSRPARFVRRFG